MEKYLVKKSEFKKMLKTLQKEHKILAPMKKDNDYFWQNWDGETLPDNYYYQNTLKPPKDLFFSQQEVILKYQKVKDGPAIIEKVEPTAEKMILFGIRPCDAKSIKLLDNVFLGKDYQDPFYQWRRLNTILISLVCQKAGQSCFCSDPFSNEGSDLMVVDLNDKYLVEIITPAGKDIFPSANYQPTDFKMLDKIQQLNFNDQKEITGGDLEGILDQKYNDVIWDEAQEKCLNCGICTFLCPTCHCFDITDDQKSAKVRSWDSCMFASFTKQGSGHNPRPTGKERLRQRIMHKFKYFPENFAVQGCVGCGRCVEKCPVNLDIREILLKIKGVS